MQVFGIDLNSLEEKKNELTNKMEEASTELNTVQNQIAVTLQDIEDLSTKIDGYETEIQNLNIQTQNLSTSISDLEQKLDTSKKRYEKQSEEMQLRVTSLYESGETYYLDVLLGSNTLSELISNYYLLSEINRLDEQLLEDIEKEKNKIETNKNSLEKQKQQLILVRNNKERTAVILENSRIQKNLFISQLNEEQRELQTQIEEYENAIKQVNEEILLIVSQNIDTEYSGGIMAWPVPGYTTLTSQFGMRLHPILRVYKLHTGIDIGAPKGANFVAAADGIVIKAGMNAGYGNVVVLDHGGGITTLYAHGSEILVSVGQQVKRGEPILKVGSTGYSTGPHAHFEVRVNGDCVQPLNFLKGNNNQAKNIEQANITNTANETINQ